MITLQRPSKDFPCRRPAYEYPKRLRKEYQKREAELVELAKDNPKKIWENEEYLKTISESERKEIEEKEKKNEQYVISKAGPLRPRPGLVGCWKQESEYEWRQIDVYNKHPEELVRVAMFGARTCRTLLWMDRDPQTHYMSAFYTPEEWDYIYEKRPTYGELLDLSVCYVPESFCYRTYLNVPLADMIFIMQNYWFFVDSFFGHVHPIDRNRLSRTDTLLYMEDVFRITPQELYQRYAYLRDIGRDYDTILNFPVYFPRRDFVKMDAFSFMARTYEAFIFVYNILKEHGTHKEEFIQLEKNGFIDYVNKEKERYLDWYYECGAAGVPSWRLLFFSKKNLRFIRERCKKGGNSGQRYGGSLEEIMCENDYLQNPWKDKFTETSPGVYNDGMAYWDAEAGRNVFLKEQLMTDPVLDDSNKALWRSIFFTYSMLTNHESYRQRLHVDDELTVMKRNIRLGRALSDDEVSTLNHILLLFDMSPELFWSFDYADMFKRYQFIMNREQESENSSGERMADIAESFKNAQLLRRKYDTEDLGFSRLGEM